MDKEKGGNRGAAKKTREKVDEKENEQGEGEVVMEEGK